MTAEQNKEVGKLITQRTKKEFQINELRRRTEVKADSLQKEIDQFNFQIREITHAGEFEIGEMSEIKMDLNKVEPIKTEE